MNKEETWHTKAKCPKQELHLVVLIKFSKEESMKLETRFTIIKDYGFKKSEGIYWSLRVELLPTKDRKRNTIGNYVKKN